MSDDIYGRLSILSDATRVRMLRLLEREELGVSELARIVQAPQSRVSRHLGTLHKEGWVERRSEGTANFYRKAKGATNGLWELVRDRVEYPEDDRRMEAILALRETDSEGFFGKLGEKWDAVRRDMYGDHYLLPTLLALVPGELVVADLGCGTGGTLVELAPHVARVIGVDREEAMLEVAERRVEGADNVDIRRGLLDDLPLDDDEVDAALCTLVLHHVKELEPVFAEMARVVRPDGRVVVLDMVRHGRDEYRRTMGHVHLGFEREDVEALAAPARLRIRSWTVLPVDPEADGPGLFVAVLSR